MNEDIKLTVVPNIDAKIENVLNKLNSGQPVDQKELDDISNLFLPSVENLYDFISKNEEYTILSFSIPILEDKLDYENYSCYSYILIVPKAILPLLKCYKFLPFSSEKEYEKFVKENNWFFMGNISERKNLQKFIEDLCRSGKTVLIKKAKWVHHVRKDKKTITRLITEDPKPLGTFFKNSNGEYTFKIINPNLENEIMEMANRNIKLESGEIMLRREKK